MLTNEPYCKVLPILYTFKYNSNVHSNDMKTNDMICVHACFYILLIFKYSISVTAKQIYTQQTKLTRILTNLCSKLTRVLN